MATTSPMTTPTTNTNTTTFQTSTEMESLQILFGNLRVLRSNEDDQHEAAYRDSVYAQYDQCLDALSTTSTSTADAIESTQANLYEIDAAFQEYYHLLVCMEQHSDSVAPRDCLDGIRLMTSELEDSLLESFEGGEGLENAVCSLRGDEHLLSNASHDMLVTLDRSSHDGILNRVECDKVLREMEERREQVSCRLERIMMAAYDVQEVARRLSFVAAEFLRGSRVRAQGGIEEICEWVEMIGDRIGDHSGYIDTNVDEELICDVD